MMPPDVKTESVEIDAHLMLLELKYPKVPVFPQFKLLQVVLPEVSTLKTGVVPTTKPELLIPTCPHVTDPAFIYVAFPYVAWRCWKVPV